MEFTQNEKMMSNINTRQHSKETVDILKTIILCRILCGRGTVIGSLLDQALAILYYSAMQERSPPINPIGNPFTHTHSRLRY